MIPTRAEAENLLKEAGACNPGPWVNHSRTAAHCAEKIAGACEELDPEKAYILGLLHDIGRKFCIRHLGHVSDGFSYMMSLGYDEVARICLTHSFHNLTTDEYIGKKVLLVDDVFGGGGTTKALRELIDRAEATVSCHAVIGVEQCANFPEDLFYLYELPVLDNR